MTSVINPDQIENSIRQAVENTFAEFVFMDAMAVNDQTDFINPLATQILIHHPFCGEIELTADEELVYKMAENIMLLPPDELSEAQKNDVLYELVNTLGGRILALLLPESITFKLGLPETTESFMDRDDEICRSMFFRIDDTYLCKINFLAEL